MKKVRVAVVGSYKGVFKEWEYLGGKKIRLYRSDMPYQPNKNRYKDFPINNVRFVKIWAYNRLEWVIIRWVKSNIIVPFREWRMEQIVKRNLKALNRAYKTKVKEEESAMKHTDDTRGMRDYTEGSPNKGNHEG